MTEIYDDIMKELEGRSCYMANVYAPYYIISYACHKFNIMNNDRKIYYKNMNIPNTRMHLNFVSPPGYMKTHYLTHMGGSPTSIFHDVGTSMIHRQSVNEASFIGTTSMGDRREGIAERFQHSVIMVDEFSGITQALKSQYNNQFESQLLAILDHGHVYKDMANGAFSYTTRLTLWTGIQPTRLDISSGLGRRFIYMLYIPTPHDNKLLLDIQSQTRNLAPNMRELNQLWAKIKTFNDDIEKIKSLTFDSSIDELYHKLHLYNFEAGYFDSIVIGYNLAKYGVGRNVNIGIFDDTIERIITQQKKWRTDIQKGIDFSMVINLISATGNSIEIGAMVERCLMYGWDATTLGNIIKAMVDAGLVKKQGRELVLV